MRIPFYQDQENALTEDPDPMLFVTREVSLWCHCDSHGICYSERHKTHHGTFPHFPQCVVDNVRFPNLFFVQFNHARLLIRILTFSQNELTRLEVPKMPHIAFFFTGNNQILKFIFVRNQNFAQLELWWFVEKPHWQKSYLLYSLFQNFTRFSDNKKCPRHPEIPRACVTYYFPRPKGLLLPMRYRLGLLVTKLLLVEKCVPGVGSAPSVCIQTICFLECCDRFYQLTSTAGVHGSGIISFCG